MIEVIGFFGILLLEAIWGVRGELTERRFALLPVASLSLIMITGGLDAYLSSPYPFGLLVLIIGIILSSLIEYLLLRYLYRQSFSHK
jgi:uncharacterized membrane protein YdjX (TVP38/TMEM64 family)